MNCNNMKTDRPFSRERGQAMVFVLLALSSFLLAVLAFAVDLGYLWFHRQTAQNAADAACTAGAMDMLYTADGIAAGNFTFGTGFDCSATAPNTGTTAPAPCWYAAANGYSSGGLQGATASSDVQVSFLSSLATIPSCNGSLSPAICSAGAIIANPFLRVSVTDRVQTFFMGLITHRKTFAVGATAVCGVVLSNSPVPVVVLDPRSSDTTFNLSGSLKLTFYGGPQRSIQVNSPNLDAVDGGGTVDLSMGGPNFTGSDFGVSGGPASPCCNFNGGSTGRWQSPTAPASDPYSQLPAPDTSSLPTLLTPYQTVPQGMNGCPALTCDEYKAGIYPSGITISSRTAIFDPGVYYLSDGLTMGSNSCVRPSALPGDGTGGTMFYFADGSSVSFVATTAGQCPAMATPFNTTSGSGFLASGVKCTPSSVLPVNIPSAISDSVLLGPCTGTYGDPLGTNDPIGEQRGVLFFQNRATSSSAQPNWGGSGQFLLAGTMYFHQCATSGTDTGLNCQSTAYNDVLTLAGDACAGSYIIGEIIVDQLNGNGAACITIDLQQNPTHYLLKAALLQ
jgi:hypothetical protein